MSKDLISQLEPIIALATPTGIGAIAVLRLSGEGAIDICNALFKGKNLSKVDSHTAHFGTIRDGDKIIDEVLVTVFKTPTSYTKEDAVEISCHGSSFIIEALIKLFIDNGVRMAEPGEYTRRAFMNGQFDLSQAEAVADLIHADSPASHDTAMQQMRGGFSSEITLLREKLIEFASLIELELDFGEEDVEFADRSQLESLIQQINVKLADLINSFQLGNVLKKGVPVVIAGKPNAGKSTLLNTLLNEDKAIVSDIPGTTRDFIEDHINIDGISYRFIDTAGLRDTEDTIEAMGVKKTLEKMDQASIVLYMVDLATTVPEEIESEIKTYQQHTDKIVTIGNKSDQLSTEQLSNYKTDLNISAKEKVNIEKVKDLLRSKIADLKDHSTDTIVTNIRHYDNLRKTEQALGKVLEAIESGISGDFLAADIRMALHHLGEITGTITTDDLLDSIFLNFCIGK